MNVAEEQSGRACKYRDVVATLACPNVADTRDTGAPASRECEA